MLNRDTSGQGLTPKLPPVFGWGMETPVDSMINGLVGWQVYQSSSIVECSDGRDEERVGGADTPRHAAF